ncbi:unnamed protein product, partial [Choristocarpus tenellus]
MKPSICIDVPGWCTVKQGGSEAAAKGEGSYSPFSLDNAKVLKEYDDLVAKGERRDRARVSNASDVFSSADQGDDGASDDDDESIAQLFSVGDKRSRRSSYGNLGPSSVTTECNAESPKGSKKWSMGDSGKGSPSKRFRVADKGGGGMMAPAALELEAVAYRDWGCVRCTFINAFDVQTCGSCGGANVRRERLVRRRKEEMEHLGKLLSAREQSARSLKEESLRDLLEDDGDQSEGDASNPPPTVGKETVETTHRTTDVTVNKRQAIFRGGGEGVNASSGDAAIPTTVATRSDACDPLGDSVPAAGGIARGTDVSANVEKAEGISPSVIGCKKPLDIGSGADSSVHTSDSVCVSADRRAVGAGLHGQSRHCSITKLPPDLFLQCVYFVGTPQPLCRLREVSWAWLVMLDDQEASECLWRPVFEQLTASGAIHGDAALGRQQRLKVYDLPISASPSATGTPTSGRVGEGSTGHLSGRGNEGRGSSSSTAGINLARHNLLGIITPSQNGRGSGGSIVNSGRTPSSLPQTPGSKSHERGSSLRYPGSAGSGSDIGPRLQTPQHCKSSACLVCGLLQREGYLGTDCEMCASSLLEVDRSMSVPSGGGTAVATPRLAYTRVNLSGSSPSTSKDDSSSGTNGG